MFSTMHDHAQTMHDTFVTSCIRTRWYKLGTLGVGTLALYRQPPHGAGPTAPGQFGTRCHPVTGYDVPTRTPEFGPNRMPCRATRLTRARQNLKYGREGKAHKCGTASSVWDHTRWAGAAHTGLHESRVPASVHHEQGQREQWACHYSHCSHCSRLFTILKPRTAEQAGCHHPCATVEL
jgi:hypothetical protein